MIRINTNTPTMIRIMQGVEQGEVGFFVVVFPSKNRKNLVRVSPFY